MLNSEFSMAAFIKKQLPAMSIVAFFLVGCMDEPDTYQERIIKGNGNTVKPVTNQIGGFIDGYWAPSESLLTADHPSDTSPVVKSQKLDIADRNGSEVVYLSWSDVSGTGEQLKVMRYAYQTSQGANAWSGPDGKNYQPVGGIPTDASATQFGVNKSTADGYALWASGTTLSISEFMGAMNHFMGETASIPEGHAAQFVTDSSGKAYLVTQTHMDGGFGLSVSTRNALSAWSAPVQLHRMNMTDAMSMPHELLTTLSDGKDNIRALWIEEQAGNHRLMTAEYMTATSSWSTATIVLNSNADTKGVELSSIKSISVSAEHQNNKLHLALYQDNGTSKAVFTLDFDSSAWGDPVRRDMDMGGMAVITSDVSYAVNHATHLVAWVEQHMGAIAINSMRFTPDGGWSDVEKMAMPDAGATISDLTLALNHDGHAAAVWLEKSDANIRVAAGLQKSGMPWSQKELIATYDPAMLLKTPLIAMYEDGTPLIVWNTANEITAETVRLTTEMSFRLDTINNTGDETVVGTPAIGSVQPNTDYVSGYWASAEQMNMDHSDPAGNPSIRAQTLEFVDVDTAFLSWSKTTDSGEMLMVMRGTNDPATGYSWTDPNEAMMQPVGISATATLTQFSANTSMEGYALWDDAGTLKISEFMEMNGAAHFMGTATLGEGHAPRILIDGAAVYLVTQAHMMNGFGIDVYTRTAAQSWSIPVPLHRMGTDAATAKAMPHDSLTTFIDGKHNIRALWIETESANTRVMTSVFDTVNGAWGDPLAVLDSTGNTHGIDLASIKSLNASGEHGNNNVHLVVFEDSANDEAVYTTDFDGTNWSMPERRDMDMNGMAKIMGEVVFAQNLHTQIVIWVEDHMGILSIKSLRFISGSGWGTIQTVASPAASSAIADIGIAINHSADALAYWTETDTTEKRILNALQPQTGDWAMKELVASYPTDTMLLNLEGALRADGTPWLIWNIESSMGSMTMFTTQLSQRKVSNSDTLPVGTTAGGGTGSGGTGGDGSGTGGGGTGGGGTDSGTGSGINTGSVSGLWGTETSISTTEVATSRKAMITAPMLQKTDVGKVFASWLLQSDPDPSTLVYTQSDISLMRATPDSTGAYSWSDPNSAMFNPMGYSVAALDSQFVVNPISGNGIATWRENITNHSSEFMETMGHFMNSAQLPDGHAVKILHDSTGQVYLLMQTHMAGGFGLSVYKRSAADQWSATPVELHRMDMTSAFNMPNHFLSATIDGQDNLTAIWQEEHLGTLSLQMATYLSTTNTWGSVTEIPTPGIILNRLKSAWPSATPGSADLQLVLHQQEGMTHSLFALSHTVTSNWSAPLRLDEPTATSMLHSAPVISTNSMGGILLAWIEMDSAMVANNSSGNMNMIMAKRYMPRMGWHAIEHIAHASMNADASSLSVDLNMAGNATAAWIESTSLGGHINVSHYTTTSMAWSQKELLAEVVNGAGTIQALATTLDKNNNSIALWATNVSDGVTDSIQVWRNTRLTAITDAVVGDGSNSGGTDGGGSGTGGGSAGGNDIPASLKWTSPVMASQMMHSTTNFNMFGPQLVLDDIGGASIRMAMAEVNGTSVSAISNHVIRSVDNSNWQDTLTGSGLFTELSNTALIESISAVPTTGNLYGLIRDGAKLYLARYLPNVGWGKLEIPDVPASVPLHSLHLTTNATGMVTIAWHQFSTLCCTIDIHAKHYVVSTGWQATETITVAAEAVLSPHVVDSTGRVHVSWLTVNPDVTQGGFNLEMATYTPMVGWSAVINGPTGLPNALVKTNSSNGNKVATVTDMSTGIHDVYVINSDGSWTRHANINQKTSGDGVSLLDNGKVTIIAGGTNHFMAAWRESVAVTNGASITRYRTAMIHTMPDPAGIPVWHVQPPSEVGGANAGLERNLNFVLDSMGNASAVWTSVDSSNNTDNVYVNQAAMGSAWATTPELLASYDMSAGSFVEHASIAINSLGKVGIAWDQHMAGSGVAMHHVWFVVSK